MSRRRIGVAAALAVVLLLAAASATLIAAAGPTDQLPPEKQALVDFENAQQQGGDPADKGKDRGAPLVLQVDPPAEVGLLGPVGAPVAGSIFTAENAWAGWLDDQTYAQVYAGAPGENRTQGLLFVVLRSGEQRVLKADGGSSSQVISAPIGGPLHIVRVEDGLLVVANPGGREIRFDPSSQSFR